MSKREFLKMNTFIYLEFAQNDNNIDIKIGMKHVLPSVQMGHL